ncbi:uncharacterized protein K452DRAFT_274376 [Aplosporella prunicola CBS 121167]|uniref:DUF1479 domain protein n=1 Tax=Aplosporella prunicola CBS 121167 TaxID=1176127 RepID=A0A6A6B6V5_9PEZI|nr:uncharacterized protein K452DRAFT_274376 [Aplosporella prunicola CBS 121167]KAF2139872.1 hypothetical protein K452DRAFT_274376 [Aplosporella prunicola CBS 121167]
MLSATRHACRLERAAPFRRHGTRTLATAAPQKRAGDISDAFVSLSGQDHKPLEPRFADLKRRLIAGREDAVRDSWVRLLTDLRQEIPLIVELGSKAVPEVRFEDIVAGKVDKRFVDEHKKRGVAIVRGVVDEQVALGWKEDLKQYIRDNPQTKAFPKDNPQVFELYWSRAQMQARTHPNMLKTQQYLMSHWHTKNPAAPISTAHPIAYADRLRMRLPGDAKFALGPHVDGGSCERWEENGYGRGHVYDSIWDGRWEDFDPWESSCRLDVQSDLYAGVGACSMFRMFQGWLSMSETGPFEGTLLVNPLLAKATAYYLLRPFFAPKRGPSATNTNITDAAFLHPDNWALEPEPSSALQGAYPGHGQELSPALHPHLFLPRTMVHVPRVRPGDYVAWHCDTIHAVDATHAGAADSSVLYIPACPLTASNARFLARQRDAFLAGTPCPDFGGGVGESGHRGRLEGEEVRRFAGVEGARALGLERWGGAAGAGALLEGQRRVLEVADQALGFS